MGILARGRQCESDVRNRSGSCASIRAKATVVKSFLRVWTKFFSKQQVCASAKAMCKTDGLPCAIIPATGLRVKSFLHVWCKLFVIAQVCATAEIIVENWSKSQKILDIATPRAAPRNSFVFFARMEGKSFDTRSCS